MTINEFYYLNLFKIWLPMVGDIPPIHSHINMKTARPLPSFRWRLHSWHLKQTWHLEAQLWVWQMLLPYLEPT